jgi:8-oxo-dGTP pyrophosphatase MutT (NUDIX family)
MECAIKELEEEAGVSKELASKLKSVDAISYAYIGTNGVKNETEFVFDLKLPLDFKPFPKDGEVECFYLMDVNEVIYLLKK